SRRPAVRSPTRRQRGDERAQNAREIRRVYPQTGSTLRAGGAASLRGECRQLAVTDASVVGGQNAEFVALRVGQHHPGLLALADVDVTGVPTAHAIMLTLPL